MLPEVVLVFVCSQVRATNLQELVYKNGQAGVTKATVTLTFNNEDKANSPVGYDSYDEITITRQVVIGGKNKYLLNGYNIQSNRVQVRREASTFLFQEKVLQKRVIWGS